MKKIEPYKYTCCDCANDSCGLRNLHFCPPNCDIFVPKTDGKQPATAETPKDAPAGTGHRVTVAGLWTSDYACKLGVQDHCLAVLEALDSLRAKKLVTQASSPLRKTMEENLANEMMDLHLILDAWAARHAELAEKRRAKFAVKHAEEALK